MENNQNQHRNPDELDPISLLENAVAFIRRFWKPIAIFMVLGLALSLFRHYSSPKLYSSRALLHSIIVTNQEQIEMIETWRKLLRKREYAELSRIMNTDENVLKKLRKIEAEEVQKLYTQHNPNGFLVDVVVTDTSVLDELELAIVTGLGNSAYIRDRVETRKARFEQMISKLSSELEKLENTKAGIDSMIRSGNAGRTSLLVDISSLNAQWIGLNEKLLSYQEDLKFASGVQVLQHFSRLSKPDNPGVLRSAVLGIAAGGFIGYLVALGLFINQRLKSRTKLRPISTRAGE